MKFLITLLLSITTANAATTGTLVLVGVIPKKVEITVTPKPVASSLDLETTQSNLSVATLTGKSNVSAGYKITVSSANNNKLVHTVNNTQFVNYTMNIDGSAANSGTQINYTGKGSFTKDVRISYTGIDGYLYDEGNYTDTVTFTITAN